MMIMQVPFHELRAQQEPLRMTEALDALCEVTPL